MKKMFGVFLFTALALAACSSIKTVHQTEPATDSPDATPTPTLIEEPAMTETPEAQQRFAAALKMMNEAAFGDASIEFERYLTDYPTSPRRGETLFNLALCYLNLDQTNRALQKTHWLLDDRYYYSDKDLQVSARLLEGEIYLRLNQPREALATTFELLPANEKERSAGFSTSGHKKNDVRLNWTGKLTSLERARIKALRGRIYGELGEIRLADEEMTGASTLLGRQKTAETQQLRGQIAMYRIEIIEKSCAITVPVPTPLSEKQALDYVDSYYRCADPARQYYCDVASAQDKVLTARALRAYQALATAPLKVADHLPPPPARPVRTEQERKFFEHELQNGIRSWSEEHIKDFRNLDSCKIANIF